MKKFEKLRFLYQKQEKAFNAALDCNNKQLQDKLFKKHKEITDEISIIEDNINYNNKYEYYLYSATLLNIVFEYNLIAKELFNEDDYDLFLERAAIIEYEGCLDRFQAEEIAFKIITEYNPDILSR